MGLFNTKPKQQLKNINGYIIDELTGMLIDVPKGLQVYIIPKEVKQLNPDLNLTANKPLANMSRASEIIFEDGSIDMLPDKYFTFGGVTVFSNLKKVTLPVGIKKVGNDCIDATKTEFNIPATMEHLGKGIYPETQRLILGNNIRSLGDAFASHDTYLQYVEVAGTIKQLPPLFVNQCKNLKTLILHEGIDDNADKTVYITNENKEIYGSEVNQKYNIYPIIYLDNTLLIKNGEGTKRIAYGIGR